MRNQLNHQKIRLVIFLHHNFSMKMILIVKHKRIKKNNRRSKIMIEKESIILEEIVKFMILLL